MVAETSAGVTTVVCVYIYNKISPQCAITLTNVFKFWRHLHLQQTCIADRKEIHVGGN